MNQRGLKYAFLFLGFVMVVTIGVAMVAAQAELPGPSPAGIYRGVSTAARFDVSPPLRSMAARQMPESQAVAPEDRPSGLEGPMGPQDQDSVVQSLAGASAIAAPLLSFDGPSNLASVSPPDPVGDVGPNHYVVMSNLYFQIFDKAGNSLFGPAANNTLWSGFGGACEAENAGDPIVVYDQLADRWFLTQFTSAGPTYFLCVAVSTTPDPTGTYHRYAINTGTYFPDYPKYAIWPDALYVSTREFDGGSFYGIGAYALNREQLLAGSPGLQVIGFGLTPTSAGGAFNIGDGLLPSDLDGSNPPPAGTPNFFVGSMDDGGPYGAPQDALTIWKFAANFADPTSSTFALSNVVPVASFDSIFPCSPGSQDCIPQPGTTRKVDIQSFRQRLIWRLAYRNFGTHESLVSNQSVEAGSNMAGIRWYEIRDPNGTPVIYQQGTFAPGVNDGIHRWMGSVAMDGSGNIALGYSASDATSTYPSVRYTGRLASDPLGTMALGEGSIIAGTGSQTGSSRWGDYTSMNIDPVDDCTFWYVNEYVPTTSGAGWRLRIGAFRFNQCGQPGFTLDASPTALEVCTPNDAAYTLTIGSTGGFTDPVTFLTTGEPAGATVSFDTNPVTPPGSSLMTIGNLGSAVPGNYAIVVNGLAPTMTVTTTVGLHLASTAPGTSLLLSPANGSVNQPLLPSLSWQPATGAASYSIDIATDVAFNTVVLTASGLAAPSFTPGTYLIPGTTYYWRVRPGNGCGDGPSSNTFYFTTAPQAGSCPVGFIANQIYAEDFESGAPNWTHSSDAGSDTWSLSTSNPYSGSTAFHADNVATVSDQRLQSPAILLPSGQDPVRLHFWNWQHMETRGFGCYDGGILEVSDDGGAIWNQIPGASLLTDPYDGPISQSFANPLAGLSAWCGNDPQPYLESVADISAYAGQLVQFRFRLGTDNSVSRPGWDIDDVTVQSCQPAVALDLSPDQSAGGNPGDSVAYTLSVTNTGSVAETFDFSVDGNWTATLSTNSLTLGIGESSTVTVTITVPTAALAGDSDTATVKAQSQSMPLLGDQALLTTTANAVVGLALSPDATASGNAGSNVVHTLFLTNTGNLIDTYILSVSANWQTGLNESIVTLPPGGSHLISLSVTVPPGATGQDVAEITAESMFDPSYSVTARFTTKVRVYWLYLPFVRRP